MQGGGELILLTHSTLRPLRRSDAAALSAQGNNRNVWIRTVGLPYPFPIKVCQQWIDARLDDRNKLILTIEVAGEPAGCIALAFHSEPRSHSAEVGYWIGEKYWNRGIMTEALGAVTTYGFVHFNLLRIQALVLQDNKASMRVLEKCGYVWEGTLRKSIEKNGRLLDQELYAILQGL